MNKHPSTLVPGDRFIDYTDLECVVTRVEWDESENAWCVSVADGWSPWGHQTIFDDDEEVELL